jgi:hypothetical protein
MLDDVSFYTLWEVGESVAVAARVQLYAIHVTSLPQKILNEPCVTPVRSVLTSLVRGTLRERIHKISKYRIVQERHKCPSLLIRAF